MFAGSWFVLLSCVLHLALAYFTVPDLLYYEASVNSVNSAKNSLLQTNKRVIGNNFQHCQGPAGQKGNCVPLESCVLRDAQQHDYINNKDYSCVLNNQRGIGVCCPDHVRTTGQDHEGLFSKESRKRRLPRSPKEEPTSETDESSTIAYKEGALDEAYPIGDYKACGRNGKTTSRTKVDAPTSMRDWPWMVAIVNKKKSAQTCGGTLITKRHVLTAAHCFRETNNTKDIFLLIGVYELSKISNSKGKYFEVEKIIIHEDFDGGISFEDDIAILVMKRATKYNSYTQPCCLPAPGARYDNMTAVVTGWGALEGGNSSDVLMEVQVPVWKHNFCKSYVKEIFKTNLCAGYLEGGKDSCNGDSGGPLTMQREDGRWVIVGLVSWGKGCGMEKSPGIYTKVYDYLNWIEDKIKA